MSRHYVKTLPTDHSAQFSQPTVGTTIDVPILWVRRMNLRKARNVLEATKLVAGGAGMSTGARNQGVRLPLTKARPRAHLSGSGCHPLSPPILPEKKAAVCGPKGCL